MAAKWKEPPRDALDRLTLEAADITSLATTIQLHYMPFDPIVKRTEGTVRDNNNNNGMPFKTTKGAPHVLLKLLLSSHPETEDVKQKVEQDVHNLGLRGIRALAVARTRPGTAISTTTETDVQDDWQFLGLLTFLDPPRPDTRQTIEDANHYGVAVKMITGDHL